MPSEDSTGFVGDVLFNNGEEYQITDARLRRRELVLEFSGDDDSYHVVLHPADPERFFWRGEWSQRTMNSGTCEGRLYTGQYAGKTAYAFTGVWEEDDERYRWWFDLKARR